METSDDQHEEMTSINTQKKGTGDFIGYSLTAYSFNEPSSMRIIKTKDCKMDKNCQHYKNAKDNKFCMEILQHLEAKLHSAEECNNGQKCQSYNRCIQGGYRLDDLIHLQLYFHPPRINHGSDNNCKQLKFVKAEIENAGLNNYNNCDKTAKIAENGLIKEITRNGYKHILTPTCGTYGDLLEVANDKMYHPLHIEYGSPLNLDEILSIILYTSTCLGFELRECEMKQNYHKWKYFRTNLANAIYKLPSLKTNTFDGSRLIYHGLNKFVSQSEDKQSFDGWWQGLTVISATIDRDIAVQFAENEYYLLEIPLNEPTFENADVSWISKFPDEKEVIILPNCGCIIKHIGVEDGYDDDDESKLQIYRVATNDD